MKRNQGTIKGDQEKLLIINAKTNVTERACNIFTSLSGGEVQCGIWRLSIVSGWVSIPASLSPRLYVSEATSLCLRDGRVLNV